MKIYMKHKDKKYDSLFISNVWQNEDDYGNGIYLDLTRNGKEFMYIDCRYEIDFNEEKVLRTVLQNYFGDNIVELVIVPENE